MKEKLLSCFFQHCGDFRNAADVMDEAQSLDTADRFINCKATKYFLRANEISRALETAGKFTRVKSNRLFVFIH